MRLSLSSRISILFAAVFLASLLPIFVWALPKIAHNLLEEKKAGLRAVVEVAVHAIASLDQEVGQGKLTREEAQRRALALVRAMRYGPEGKDYLWINDTRPYMVMHPYVTKLEGQDLSDYKDPQGKKLFVAMVEVARSAGAGFVDYMWQWKDDKNRIVPKISYVRLYQPWGWIVGSGLYIEDLRAQTSALTWGIALSAGGLGLVLAVLGPLYIWRVSRRLGGLADDLHRVSEELSLASEQAQASSERLSDGASQQAAALEQSSSALEQIASMGRHTAERTGQAQAARHKAQATLDQAGALLGQMGASMQSLRASGEQMARIIKAIDEIAFQTNLLALNAAVEAARAGEQGAGFAVVAEEVRSLARRAAEAAHSTQELIEGSVQEIGRGDDLARQSGEAFSVALAENRTIGELVDGMAASAQEQAKGIDQVNRGVAEVDQVVQANAAAAQENAASAITLSHQARAVADRVDRLHAVIRGRRR
ncbi:MAG: methyl-accepting chemotaxis protein [Thermodesulfobacteriota bacterium]